MYRLTERYKRLVAQHEEYQKKYDDLVVEHMEMRKNKDTEIEGLQIKWEASEARTMEVEAEYACVVHTICLLHGL